MVSRLAIIATLFTLLTTSVAAEPRWRLGFNLASLHLAPTAEFNEFNPGVNISLIFRDELAFQYGFQVGGYVNSYNDRTLYGLTFANWRLLSMDNVEFRLGGFVGMFEYPNLIEEVNAAGWVSAGDMVLVLGSTLTMRMSSGTDLIVGFIPAYGKDTKGIFTLQTSIALGRARR